MSADMEAQVNAIFQGQEHVYCGDCCWYVPGQVTAQGTRAPRCRHPHAWRSVETFERIVAVPISPEERNAHNDCQDWRQYIFWRALWQEACTIETLCLAFLVLLPLVLWLMALWLLKP